MGKQDGKFATLAAKYDLSIFDGNLSGRALPGNCLLKNQFAIAKFTIKEGANDITPSITRFFVSDGENGYYIKLDAGMSNIYLAMNPVNNKALSINVYRGGSAIWYTKTSNAVTLEANKIYPASVTMEALPANTLPGVFSAENNTTRHFSRANLQKVNDGYGFLPQQYSYVKDSDLDLFDWDNANSTSFTDWSVLGMDDWEYLINTRSGDKYATAKLMGTTTGLILFPDNYAHPIGLTAVEGINVINETINWEANQYTEEEWDAMEAAGAVFLPAAGYHNGFTMVNEQTGGYYWTSTPAADSNGAYFYFGTTGAHTGSTSGAHTGTVSKEYQMPVRLVR